ncbi:hypothetical protein V1503_06185 [Bacillus sp. SCS-151]|uniref:hypothetical protein n=1 Tax=Nanhaiella sioensis TaxID=3115293 RepID=UPI003978667C
MLFERKVKTVGSVSEFISGEWRLKDEIKRFNKKAKAHGVKVALITIGGGLAINFMSVGATNLVYAEGPVEYVKGAAKEKIVAAFMPLVDMIQALSYPIAMVMLTSGAILFMINRKDKGIDLIQNASVGYILVQLMPLLMRLLVGIGDTVG